MIIHDFVTNQDNYLNDVGEKPIRFRGKRRLHAIDCQNLFCEIDKYSRKKSPQFNVGRTKIKQPLKPQPTLPPTIFPAEVGLA